MEIDDLIGSRYDIAIDRFKDGERIIYKKIGLISRNDTIECRVPSSWQENNVSEERAKEDLSNSEMIFSEL